MNKSTAMIWVTGATGFIGAHMCRGLADAGHRVIGFGRCELSPAQHPELGLHGYYSGGLTRAVLDAAVKAYGHPQRIYHFIGGATVGASFAAPYVDFEQNVGAAACVFDAVKDYDPSIPMNLTSSAAIFGDGYQGPIGSDAPLAPMSPYGVHKKMMEDMAHMYAQTYGLSINVIRLFSVYGPDLKKQLLWDMCRRLKAGETCLTLGGTGQELRDWCHVDDIVRYFGALNPAKSGQVDIRNIGTGIATPISEIAAHMARAWPEDVTIEFSGHCRAGDPFSLVAAPNAVSDTLSGVSVAEGIAGYVEWFRSTEMGTA